MTKTKNGALTGTRTQDPVIKSHLLYQLSYERTTCAYYVTVTGENQAGLPDFGKKIEKIVQCCRSIPAETLFFPFAGLY